MIQRSSRCGYCTEWLFWMDFRRMAFSTAQVAYAFEKIPICWNHCWNHSFWPNQMSNICAFHYSLSIRCWQIGGHKNPNCLWHFGNISIRNWIRHFIWMEPIQQRWLLSGELHFLYFFLLKILWTYWLCNWFDRRTASEYLEQVEKLINNENITTDMSSYSIFMNLLGKALKRLEDRKQVMKILGKSVEMTSKSKDTDFFKYSDQRIFFIFRSNLYQIWRVKIVRTDWSWHP